MQAFTIVKGPAGHLPLANVDTDVIIRVDRFMLPPDQMGPWAFEPLRYLPDGTENPDFVFNREPFRGAPLLLAGENFGCGSSREAAVWAIRGMGLRCVIAPTFGDIFYGNCFQNGVLPIRLPAQTVEMLAAATADGSPLEADLVTCQLRTASGRVVPFEVDATRREALLEGLDEIGLTLKEDAAIRAWQAADRKRRRWAWHVADFERPTRVVRAAADVPGSAS